MRIFDNPFNMVREVERDLFEMGIKVHPQTMQDRVVVNDPDYDTMELQAYAFQINGWNWNPEDEALLLNYTLEGQNDHPAAGYKEVCDYVNLEFEDRISREPSNPGKSWEARPEVWRQFLHAGRFAYTYSERLAPQWPKFLNELKGHPETRQAILNLHSNICCRTRKGLPETAMGGAAIPDVNDVVPSADYVNMGGSGRIPCSLYYQAIKRNGKLDWIYAMRSCDFVVHFGVDIALALRLQNYVAQVLEVPTGMFTYITGSLHAYHKDLKTRGIF